MAHGLGTDNPRLRSALVHAGRRWPVLSVYWATGGRCACGRADCPSPAKHPIPHLAPNGVKHATTSLVVIRAWWANAPLANPALAPGEASGVVVLDVDGHAGANSPDNLELDHGALPLTQRVRTSSGEHLYFAYPRAHLKNTASKLGAGLDIRCCGGYGVAVGAVHQSRHVYAWKHGPRPDQALLTEMPAWLVDRLTPGHHLLPTRPTGPHKGYASAALASEETQLLQTPTEQRNARLNLAAFRLARFISTAPSRRVMSRTCCSTRPLAWDSRNARLAPQLPAACAPA